MRLAAVLLAVLFSFVGVGYWYYQDTQERIDTLRENNAKLEQANRTSTETIARMQEDAVKMQQAMQELTLANQRAEARVAKLQGLFSDINLEKQALEDPAATEEKINNGTRKVLKRIEALTATPKSE